MSGEVGERLIRFLRKNGNILELRVVEGDMFDHRKCYRSSGKDGSAKGTPHHELTVDPYSCGFAAGLLRSEIFLYRDDPHFLLGAELVHGHFEEGGSIARVVGIRTGEWHVFVERGYAALMPDGRNLFTRTEEGARRKLLAVSRTERSRRSGSEAGSRVLGRSSNAPEAVFAC